MSGRDYRIMVAYVLSAAARFPCNGDNGSQPRRPCTDADELPCPWCMAKRLKADRRTYKIVKEDQ